MRSLIIVFADAMLWGSIPLIAGMGYWEEHLKVSAMDHILMQIFLVALVFLWIWIWLSIGDNTRCEQESMRRELERNREIHLRMIDSDASSVSVNYCNQRTNENTNQDLERKLYVSNH